MHSSVSFRDAGSILDRARRDSHSHLFPVFVLSYANFIFPDVSGLNLLILLLPNSSFLTKSEGAEAKLIPIMIDSTFKRPNLPDEHHHLSDSSTNITSVKLLNQYPLTVVSLTFRRWCCFHCLSRHSGCHCSCRLSSSSTDSSKQTHFAALKTSCALQDFKCPE